MQQDFSDNPRTNGGQKLICFEDYFYNRMSLLYEKQTLHRKNVDKSLFIYRVNDE